MVALLSPAFSTSIVSLESSLLRPEKSILNEPKTGSVKLPP